MYSIGVTLISLRLNELADHSRPQRTFNEQLFVRVTTSIKFVRLMNQAYPGHVYYVMHVLLDHANNRSPHRVFVASLHILSDIAT